MAGKEDDAKGTEGKKEDGAAAKEPLKDLTEKELENISAMTVQELTDYLVYVGDDLTPNSLRKVKAAQLMAMSRERAEAAKKKEKEEQAAAKEEEQARSKSRQSLKVRLHAATKTITKTKKEFVIVKNPTVTLTRLNLFPQSVKKEESSDAESEASTPPSAKGSSARKFSPMKISSQIEEHLKRRIPPEEDYAPLIADAQLAHVITLDADGDKYRCRGQGCNINWRMDRLEAQMHTATHHSAVADDSAEATKRDGMQLYHIADFFGQKAYTEFICPRHRDPIWFESDRFLIDHIKDVHHNMPERLKLNDPEAFREMPASMLHEFRQEVFPGKTHRNLPASYVEHVVEVVHSSLEEDHPDQRFHCLIETCNEHAELTSAEVYLHHYNHHTREREAIVAEFVSLFPSVMALYDRAKRSGQSKFECRFGMCAPRRERLIYESMFELTMHLAKEHKTQMLHILDSQGKRKTTKRRRSETPPPASDEEEADEEEADEEPEEKKEKKGSGRPEIFDETLITEKNGKFFPECCPEHHGFVSKCNAERHMKLNCPAGKKMLDARGIVVPDKKQSAKKMKRHGGEKQVGGEHRTSHKKPLWKCCAVKQLSPPVIAKRSLEQLKKEKRDRKKHHKHGHTGPPRCSSSDLSLTHKSRWLDTENIHEQDVFDDDDNPSDYEPPQVKKPKTKASLKIYNSAETPKTHKEEDGHRSENSASRASGGRETPKGAGRKIKEERSEAEGESSAHGADVEAAAIKEELASPTLRYEKSDDEKTDDEADRSKPIKSEIKEEESGSRDGHSDSALDDKPYVPFQEGQDPCDIETPPFFKGGGSISMIKEEPVEDEEDYSNARGRSKHSGEQETKNAAGEDKDAVVVDLVDSDEDVKGTVDGKGEASTEGKGDVDAMDKKKDESLSVIVTPDTASLPVHGSFDALRGFLSPSTTVVSVAAAATLDPRAVFELGAKQQHKEDEREAEKLRAASVQAAALVVSPSSDSDVATISPKEDVASGLDMPPLVEFLGGAASGGQKAKTSPPGFTDKNWKPVASGEVRMDPKKALEAKERRDDDARGRALKNEPGSSKQNNFIDDDSDNEAEGDDGSDAESDSSSSSAKAMKAAFQSVKLRLQEKKPLAESANESARDCINKAIALSTSDAARKHLGDALNALDAQKSINDVVFNDLV